MDYEAYAKQFYGASYHNAKNPAKLHDACKWLDKALKFKTQNKLNIKKKTKITFNTTLKTKTKTFT